MGMIDSVLKKLFGTKSDKDLKEVQPIVDRVKEAYLRIDKLSNDELRAESQLLRKQIADYIAGEEREVAAHKERAEGGNISVEEKEELFREVDKLKKRINEKIDEKLLEILPVAFAIVKSTARRFKESEAVEVTASDFDRDLAATRESVTINGNTARWSSSWVAGGNIINWDMVHYDVQLFGGVVLHKGKIAEMGTGEGKTLVATLPVFLNALSGKGVHVVTVNNYLATRDSEWMGPLYEFHGLRVDCIDKHQPNSNARRRAYQADITFGTNNEFGFDYLRDNMSLNVEDLVQRENHQYAIVDEVDSVLIDDARTPLIISGPVQRTNDHQSFDEYRSLVENLYEKQRALVTKLLNKARKQLADGNENECGRLLLLANKGLPKYKPLVKFLLEPGMKVLMKKIEAIYLQDNGRKMPLLYNDLSDEDIKDNDKVKKEGEKLKKEIEKKSLVPIGEDGNQLPVPVEMKNELLTLEQELKAIENKELKYGEDALYFVIEENQNSVDLSEKGFDVLADRVDIYMPDLGDEIAKLEQTQLSDNEKQAAKDELRADYAVRAERVHTVNQLLKAYAMFEVDVDYVVMAGKVQIVDEQTGRILEGRRYSDGLHQAIEAKEKVKVEAATQTFATITLQNYFRMYHKLAGMTGTAETEAGEFWSIYKLEVVVIPTNRPVVRIDAADYLYRTKQEKYKAVINEIERLSKELQRPVLVGTTSVEVSEQLSRLLKMRGVKHNVLNAKEHKREAEIVAEAGQPGAVTIATNMAGRGTDIKLGAGVREAGGLAIIGTERHDSRRVDRQLRGRAGRQGDPGTSQFYVSLEDDLMRLFAAGRVASVMDRLGFKEGEVIQSSMISRSVERAQRKVEENNFGIRKRLLEYDDVMNNQRTAVYARRNNALKGERVAVDIQNMVDDYAESLINQYRGNVDFKEFETEVGRLLSIDPGFDEAFFNDASAADLTAALAKNINESYQRRIDAIATQALPVLKQVYETQGSMYEKILVPISDRTRIYQVAVGLKKAVESEGRELSNVFSSIIILRVIDEYWQEHLREMDDLRQSVQNATYEQKDPLLVYKIESFDLFKGMLDKVNHDVISALLKAFIPLRDPNEVREAADQPRRSSTMNNMRAGRQELGAPAAPGQQQQIDHTPAVRTEKKVGRNDPCPCGSGKKYKACHGKLEE